MKKEHLIEIFGHYGSVKYVDLETDRRNGLSKGIATIGFESERDASNAMLFLDGGQIDGNTIKVSFILVQSSERNRRTGKKLLITSFSATLTGLHIRRQHRYRYVPQRSQTH